MSTMLNMIRKKQQTAGTAKKTVIIQNNPLAKENVGIVEEDDLEEIEPKKTKKK